MNKLGMRKCISITFPLDKSSDTDATITIGDKRYVRSTIVPNEWKTHKVEELLEWEDQPRRFTIVYEHGLEEDIHDVVGSTWIRG